jgi:hypothetical protein
MKSVMEINEYLNMSYCWFYEGCDQLSNEIKQIKSWQ